MSLIEKAKLMKGEKIKVRYIKGFEFDDLTEGRVYNAVHDGIGSVGNALFKDLIDDYGHNWSGQLNGFDGFRMLLYSNVSR